MVFLCPPESLLTVLTEPVCLILRELVALLTADSVCWGPSEIRLTPGYSNVKDRVVWSFCLSAMDISQASGEQSWLLQSASLLSLDSLNNVISSSKA